MVERDGSMVALLLLHNYKKYQDKPVDRQQVQAETFSNCILFHPFPSSLENLIPRFAFGARSITRTAFTDEAFTQWSTVFHKR